MFITSIDPYLLAILAFCVISQSLFGIGVLLWGTPALLFLGETYLNALLLLLPISITINILQILPERQNLETAKIVEFIKLATPGLILSLTIILFFEIDASLLVALALLVAGLLRMQLGVTAITIFRKFTSILPPAVGFLHGASNLGGPILILWASLSTSDKTKLRTTVATCYFLMALMQMITIFIVTGEFKINIFYLSFCLIIYFISNRCLFRHINQAAFQNILTMLIFAMACLLVLKWHLSM